MSHNPVGTGIMHQDTHQDMHQELYQQGIGKASAADWTGAIESFDQVLQLNPDFAAAYYQRGLVRFKQGNLHGAIEDYTRAALSDANNPTVHYARSLAHLSAGNTEAAVADAKQAVLLKPDYAAAYHLLATVRQKQGATDKAIVGYKKAAELYLDHQDIANCRRCLEAIHKLQPPPVPSAPIPAASFSAITPEDFLQQAIEKAKRRNFAAALEDLDWVLQLDPGDTDAYIHRGQVRAELGDRSGAIADYRQAAQIFLDRADKNNAQALLIKIQQLQQAQPQRTSSTSPRNYPKNVVPFPSRKPGSNRKPSPAIQQKLLRLIGDDRRIVAGLVERLRQRHPDMPEDWYWEKAIYDLERDRR